MRCLEVAEFFGPQWMALESPDGKPTLPIQFEKANHFSRIYLPAGGQLPIWENPVVHVDGLADKYFVLNSTATQVLAKLGLPVK